MHNILLRVYFEDTDAQGVVYYANYLRYFERARTEYLREVGYGQRSLMEKGGIFVVRKLEMKFKKPAILDNEIMIETKLLKLGHVSFDFLQKIYFEDSLLVEATVGCGCLEVKTFNPLPLPKKLYAGMKTLL
jgi:acyl-CoA thioester hydrolase